MLSAISTTCEIVSNGSISDISKPNVVHHLEADGWVDMSGMTVIDEYSMRNLLNNVASLIDSQHDDIDNTE